jgi:hypothetical protein
MPAKPETSTLRDTTIQLLENRSRMLTIEKISSDTGLSEDFLYNFGAGKRPNASVNKVQTLYEYLTNAPLAVNPDVES